ncbi:NrfD/PsrC family molybdoenzyme membrane anchor subunit [Methylobacterium sp. WSM2598]|uniref:NrfD/PsrC family molybdoenzyme membrane anchor subunit n=1 Tax=Methylobacterium sp. WSM2598 TaxID=398261 RepID=UPI00035F7ED7|nr:NrfD/PsrC family molybdoenzyme membrane anchor subunit [Methylobacterium sp. WSM2598]
MAEYPVVARGPEAPLPRPDRASGARRPEPGEAWAGPTYYGRAQLKPAPFENAVVGGYIFLAGLSGSSAILAALAEATRGVEAGPMIRRARYTALLAPTLGSALLIYDLHTPSRFYNMLRVAKATSPMSIGTWILMGFSACAGVSAAAQVAADLGIAPRTMRGAARAAGVPAALLGAGLSTYTAALLSATSTPLWAAAPRALAVRFGASSVASGAAALAMAEPAGPQRDALHGIAAAALAVELAGDAAAALAYRRTGVEPATRGRAGTAEKVGAVGLGVLLPLGLYAAERAMRARGRRPPAELSVAAGLAVLAGSALLRISVMGAGDESAARPDVSFRFAQPENLPETSPESSPEHGPPPRTGRLRAAHRSVPLRRSA